MRLNITLACTECSERNYSTTKNRQTNQQRLTIKKYCPRCGRHTPHQETR